MSFRSEFTVPGAYSYNQASPFRWVVSHLFRYKPILGGFTLLALLSNVCSSLIPTLIGVAFALVVQRQAGALGFVALALVGLALAQGALELGAHFSSEVLGERFARDASEELYINLLGKSQTFHNRQRVGDIMARTSSDMVQLGNMVSPGFDTIFISFSNLLVTFLFVAAINPQLLLVPLLFTAIFLLALRQYSRQLTPVSMRLRMEFGETSAVLNEAMSGIELVKATGQEEQEMEKFTRQIARFRDAYVENGKIEGRYLPLLLLGIALALALLHGLFLLSLHQIALGGLVAFMGLMANLRTLTSISFWTFALVQWGMAGGRHILDLMQQESELDENEQGYKGTLEGDIVFERVTFGYGEQPILQDISFHIQPGWTVALVGQVGSGKSSLAKLVNRIYDVREGRVLVDGRDVRDWNLGALRSQISTIEQDVFLFSRSVAENIAYGFAQRADRSAIENAARQAQAHEFIERLPQGYDTELGDRGITLSGGQRQRLAIARALLTDPRILILDDSTSAIDSATEDEIQKAIRRVQEGRTTLFITHRLSQIRRADSILVLDRGRLVDQGTHEELLARCPLYRRLFPCDDLTVAVPVAQALVEETA